MCGNAMFSHTALVQLQHVISECLTALWLWVAWQHWSNLQHLYCVVKHMLFKGPCEYGDRMGCCDETHSVGTFWCAMYPFPGRPVLIDKPATSDVRKPIFCLQGKENVGPYWKPSLQANQAAHTAGYEDWKRSMEHWEEAIRMNTPPAKLADPC